MTSCHNHFFSLDDYTIEAAKDKDMEAFNPLTCAGLCGWNPAYLPI